MAHLADLGGAVLGQYQLSHVLGEGENAVVYLASHEAMSQPVAVKIFDPGFAARPEFRLRLDTELRTLAGLGHPNILPVDEHGVTANGLAFVAMAVASGGTLRAVLDRGPLEAGQALRLLRAIASALQSAHQAGVLHRDLKPANVLLDGEGTPLVADFGMPRISYGFVGTPGYMSPEQATGQRFDHRADVYALAVLAFEMLTGSSPYLAETPPGLIEATVRSPVPSASERNPSLPAELDRVFFRALAKDPTERTAGALQLVEELSQALLGPRRSTAGEGSVKTYARRMDQAQRAVEQALETGPDLREAAMEILEALGANLEWSAGSFWMVDEPSGTLRCAVFWKAPGFECEELERLTMEASPVRGTGVAGRVWAAAEPLWVGDLLRFEDIEAVLPVLQADLRSALGVPVLEGGQVRGVIELWAPRARAEDGRLLARLRELGQRVGTATGDRAPRPD